MKSRMLKKSVYKSVAEFEKVFLPETYKARMSSEQNDAVSIGVQMAERVIQAVETRSRGGKRRAAAGNRRLVVGE